MKKHYKRVLTIAGSDPSGGAGIQADLKTFSACGCYGMSAIVAVVDENTVGVTGVHPVPVDFVTGQIRSVLDLSLIHILAWQRKMFIPQTDVWDLSIDKSRQNARH